MNYKNYLKILVFHGLLCGLIWAQQPISDSVSITHDSIVVNKMPEAPSSVVVTLPDSNHTQTPIPSATSLSDSNPVVVAPIVPVIDRGVAVETKSKEHFEDEENLDPLQFKNYEEGDSHHKFSFEFNVGGGLANSVFYPSLAWNLIFRGGAYELHVPFVIWVNHTLPDNPSDVALVNGRFTNASNNLFGTGMQLRSFYENHDKGPFYGGGIRVNYWMVHYDVVKQQQLGSTMTTEKDWNVIPLLEGGYLYPIEQVRNLSVQGALELGWNLVQQSYDQSETTGNMPFAQTSFYWTIQLGAVYAF